MAKKVAKESEDLPGRIIAVDPGVDNLGWCITTREGKLLDWGLVTKTLDDVKTPGDIAAFHENMKPLVQILSAFPNQEFIMERYMPRGMRRGNQVERINIVIGYLLGVVPYNSITMVPASSWKNHCEKHYTYVDNPTVPPHIVDAYTMALYYAERVKGFITPKEVKRHLRSVRENEWGWKKKKNVWTRIDPKKRGA